MLTSACPDKKAAKKFATDYANRKVMTDVATNLVNFPEARNFLETIKRFHTDTDGGVLFFSIGSLDEVYLRHRFGKEHFRFDGNREYKNWVISYKDETSQHEITLILPRKN